MLVSFSLFIMTISRMANPHKDTIEAAFVRFKELASSLEGWNLASEKQGVKLYSYDANPIIVRGVYEVTDTTLNVHQIMAVASSAGTRKICKLLLMKLIMLISLVFFLGDDKFDAYELKTVYDSGEILFWAKVKTPWPITPRDMCTIVRRVREENETDYVVMASVEDDSVPEMSGNVRAELLISGWKVAKTTTGSIEVTYITQIDLKGSIPGAFLKNIQIQVPLCAEKVVEYAKEHGYPPYVIQAQQVQFESEEFDHETKTYKASWNAIVDKEAKVEFDISKTTYPQDPQVTLNGEGQYTLEDGRLTVYDVVGAIQLEITRN